ncbi:MBL fold metallo-hydrolase [Paenactinomyces guangxiensis]|uniref:MBL fold metallo-hydrolase n=1 Tax=Paenactinomyces guangxiensis TaxID=1490290 RepID=A0A7W1WQ92_9BACL|nr:MBL fold metallo-hydrolase [Paenactinomyces guangxiensis]MBA4494080.1 MBL fold metallo-hydrolase [Paenactinomyces guangxiensis]MBH8591175.1 MBL fold metallo-hydrolase [Paenactinomyces guangxiensis]
MRFSVLASGSTGNCIFIESERARVLVDAGLSGKQIEQRLQKIGIDPTTLTAVFVSHEHIDHVKGLGVLVRRYQIPIYTNEATWNHLPSSVGEIPELYQNIIETGASLELEDVRVESIPVSHDAAEPMGFQFRQKTDETLAVITDLGYVNQRITDQVTGVDTLIWESNHDVDMLRMGSYPWNVKRRILSDMGHLSNQDAGEALTDIVRGMGENVYLAHLSRDNNLSELAHLTVKNILEDTGLQVGRDVYLWPTYDDRPTPLREVRMKVKR